jgi:hypothetical protein
MKKLLIILLLLTSINAKVDSDKISHTLVGAGIYGLCLLTGEIMKEAGYNSYLDSTTCLLPVAVAGIGKEIYDANHEGHNAEWEDFAYTMAIPITTSIVLYKW